MSSALALQEARPYSSDMTPEREDAVRRALKIAPSSMLALAQEAGVSEKLLRLIRDEKRSATPRVVEALAGALERVSDRHGEAARILREVLRREGADR